MEKKIGRFWLYCGRNSGISLGFNMDKYHVTFELLFWYVGWEFHWK